MSVFTWYYYCCFTLLCWTNIYRDTNVQWLSVSRVYKPVGKARNTKQRWWVAFEWHKCTPACDLCYFSWCRVIIQRKKWNGSDHNYGCTQVTCRIQSKLWTEQKLTFVHLEVFDKMQSCLQHSGHIHLYSVELFSYCCHCNPSFPNIWCSFIVYFIMSFLH